MAFEFLCIKFNRQFYTKFKNISVEEVGERVLRAEV